jgi:outer membrane protein insertion porin family
MNRLSHIVITLLAGTLLSGAQTQVRIQGTRLKSEAELLELMGGRLEHVLAKPAIGSRADDAAFLLRQVMLNDGYNDAQVNWRIINPREILLMVNEGRRLELGNVTIRGVGGDDSNRLARIYSRPAVRDRPLVAGRAPFREEDVDEGLAALQQEFNAMGYWGAQANLASQVIHPVTGVVDVVIDVDRGPLYRIGTPRIGSEDGRGVQRAAAAAAPFVGEAATTAAVNQMRAAVAAAFTSVGYPDSEILMGTSLESPLFIPEFSVNLGNRVRLERVEIEGTKRTNPNRVLRRLRPMEGDWYDEAAMNERLRQFLSTGAFASSRVEREETIPGFVTATLHFEEARAKEVTLGAGVGSYEGFLFRANYADRNLFGQLLGLNAGVEFSSRGMLGETRVTEPWLLGSDFSLTARIYALVYGRDGYESFETGFEGILGRTFGNYNIELMAGYSYFDVTPEGLPRAVLGPGNYTNPKIRFTQMLDYRDSQVMPKSGWYLRMPLEIGVAISGETDVTYVSGSLTGAWHYAINQKTDLAIGGQVAAVLPSGESPDLPIDLRVFIGGARSVRSYPERQLGPRVGTYATGGEASWRGNAEVVRDLAGPLRGVVFVDAGTLARSFDALSQAEIELAAGMGLRLELPIGPIRVEYGHNLTRDTGEPSGTFHFAIGAAF